MAKESVKNRPKNLSNKIKKNISLTFLIINLRMWILIN